MCGLPKRFAMMFCRGEMARFAIKQRVTHPEELQAFTGAALSGRLAMPQSPARVFPLRHLLAHNAGSKGAWTYCEEESTETNFVFHRNSKEKSSRNTAKSSAKRKDASTNVKQHKGAGTAVVSPRTDRKRKGAKK